MMLAKNASKPIEGNSNKSLAGRSDIMPKLSTLRNLPIRATGDYFTKNRNESSLSGRLAVVVASHLTPDQVRAYRIADNKTNELAEWNYDSPRTQPSS